MAVVITNGTYYVRFSENGGIKKTNDINEAHQFTIVGDAIATMKKARAKTQGYVVLDNMTNRVLWKWMTQEELAEVREQKRVEALIKRDKDGRIKRKSYAKSTRKMIYDKSNGHCELCGRSILFEEMTLDHIKALSMGGIDDVSNLQSCCHACNLFKGSIAPEVFEEKISSIFMYQMKKKTNNCFKWKIAQKILNTIM